MSKKSDDKLFEFMVLMCNQIEEYISEFDNVTQMLEHHKSYNATLMCLLQIGETINKLQNNYDILDKSDIKGAYDVRNFIAHDYMGVDLGLIEYILREKLPNLKESILILITNSKNKKA